MITFLVGQRGVGKSSLLKRIADYLPTSQCLDLDSELERNLGLNSAEVFRLYGEEYFRRAEIALLDEILKRLNGADAFIALGAGFSGDLPKEARVLWVQRVSDESGRIFFDRPALAPGLAPLEDYLSRRDARRKHYSKIATDEIILRETRENFSGEAEYFRDEICALGGVLTLLPRQVEVPRAQLKSFLGRRLGWGLKAFELRDDLLSLEKILEVLDLLPPEKILLSLRKNPKLPSELESLKFFGIDYALELGGEADRSATVVSLHRKSERISDDFGLLEKFSPRILKYAPEISSFADLLAGDAWQQEDPRSRIFLPRSQDGAWSWYRSLSFQRMPWAFFREGEGSAFDQPTLLELMSAKKSSGRFFAAVLGDPVKHSLSPTEHEKFFAQRGMPFVAVPLAAENFSQALPVLESLGLRAAAITSPLKKLAAAFGPNKSALVQELESANTLFIAEGSKEIRTENTDFGGLESLLEGLPRDGSVEIVVWGGGGVLAAIQKILPRASFYSASKNSLRKGSPAASPQFLIWAAGPRAPAPVNSWRPQKVIDLNYREDSEARAYALQVGACYLSGLKIFHRQAYLQQQFWKANDGQ